jgi:hypothetical protein
MFFSISCGINPSITLYYKMCHVFFIWFFHSFICWSLYAPCGPKIGKNKILDSCKLQKGCTRLATASDKVYQLLAQGRWFSPGTPASSNTKTGRHDIAEILLIVTLNTKIQILNSNSSNFQMNQFSTLWPLRDMYPITKQSHTAVGHGGLHKTYNDLKTHYANISREVIKTFLKLCEHCALKKKTFWAFKTSHQTSQIVRF